MGDLALLNIPEFETVPIYIGNNLDSNPNAQDAYGNTLLHNYVKNHTFMPNILKRLLDKGADLEIRDRTGKTAFLLAVFHRQKAMIESFIEHKADVHVQDYEGNNAAHYMALPELNRHPEHVDAGAFSSEPTDEMGLNFDDTDAILKTLLCKGVNVNLRNNRGETPLMLAARGGRLEIVKLLLEFGANVHLRNENMQTCLHVALNHSQAGHRNTQRRNVIYAIVLELARNEACVNCFDKGGSPVLRYVLINFETTFSIHFSQQLMKVAALVNWRKRTSFYLSRRQVIGQRKYCADFLVSHTNNCYNEIHRMRVHELPGGSNLCQFALRGMSEDEKSSEYEINDKVLGILMREAFPIYHDFILSKFKRSYLGWKVSDLVFTARRDKRIISLNYYTIFEISSHLERGDLFNLLCTPLRRHGLTSKPNYTN